MHPMFHSLFIHGCVPMHPMFLSKTPAPPWMNRDIHENELQTPHTKTKDCTEKNHRRQHERRNNLPKGEGGGRLPS